MSPSRSFTLLRLPFSLLKNGLRLLRWTLFKKQGRRTALLAFVMVFHSAIWRFIVADSEDAFLPYRAQQEVRDRDGKVYLDQLQFGKASFSGYKVPGLHLYNALVASEDHRFEQHHGIDFKGVARALYRTFLHGDAQGGSTITMQLAAQRWPDDFPPPEECWSRHFGWFQGIARKVHRLHHRASGKVFEWPMALLIELEARRRFDNTADAKEAIAAQFLKYVDFKYARTRGFDQAAYRFFHKNLEDLTLGESAVLVGMLRATTAYNPYRNLDRAFWVRNSVVQKMEKLGFAEPGSDKRFWIKDRLKKRYQPGDGVTPDRIINEMNQLAERRDISKSWPAESLIIDTSLNPHLQGHLKKVARSHRRRFQRQGGAKGLEICIVAIDNETGGVVGFVPGPTDYKKSKRNTAFTGRSPIASCCKPFVYALYLDTHQQDSITTVIKSRPFTLEEERLFSHPPAVVRPQTDLTLRNGLSASNNYLAVRLGIMLPPGDWPAFLAATDLSLNYQNLDDQYYRGVSGSLVDLTAAYRIFSNKGVYQKPFLISKVRDREGRVLYQHLPRPVRLCSERAVEQVRLGLHEVFRSGTVANYGGRHAIRKNRHLIGKTGTQTGGTDLVFVGATLQYTVGVWIGCPDDNQRRVFPKKALATGGSKAYPIFQDVIAKL